jgi:PAS domain S-box-containing protein
MIVASPETSLPGTENEATFRDLFDEAPVAYHELDLEGQFTRVNHTELRMLGYSIEEMAGRPVWDFIVEKFHRGKGFPRGNRRKSERGGAARSLRADISLQGRLACSRAHAGPAYPR